MSSYQFLVLHRERKLKFCDSALSISTENCKHTIEVLDTLYALRYVVLRIALDHSDNRSLRAPRWLGIERPLHPLVPTSLMYLALQK
ncbi:unnamed protein product [Nesidiocoris tenuis]|uniref:Uncharacterized protein n=1 Tax=Nesidiocoris tenuis TaxID=355587 RepID=A0A6H5GNX6_9HEMI|nr:unnamed protein product [Nesidiocoris tenuis]